jgi:hypothetical protein
MQLALGAVKFAVARKGRQKLMNQSEQGKKISQIIAKAWADDGFKKRLVSDTKNTLKAEGLDVPADLNVKAVEDTENVFHFVLPAKPSDVELSEEYLSDVAGGITISHCCCSYIPTCAPTPDGKPPQLPPFSSNCQMCSNT